MNTSSFQGRILYLAVAVLLCAPAAAQDQAGARNVVGTEKAAGAQVVLNQVDTSAYPKVTIFATVMKNGAPLKGLGAADFRVEEDEVEQKPLTVEPKLTPLNAVLALDTSGSMGERLADARAAAKSFIDLLAPEDKMQVLSFSSEVKVLGSGTDAAGAKAAMDMTVARGTTALYDALFESVSLLQDKPGRKAIALLSDGADNNGHGGQLSKHSVDDALKLARDVNVPIFTIGVGREIDQAVLKKVADQTGGQCLIAPQPSQLKEMYDRIGEQLSGQYNIYYTSNLPSDGREHRLQLRYGEASGSKDFKAPTQTAQAPPAAPPDTGLIDKTKKQKELLGEAVKGGNDWDEAVPLKPGLYHLSHHQRGNEFDYFTVELKPGQKLVVTQNCQEHGVEIDGDKVKITNNPGAALSVCSGDRKKQFSLCLRGGQFVTQSDKVVGTEATGGKCYVLVGDQYPMNMEATFQIDVINLFDAGSDRDAGSSEEAALEIAPGTYPQNYLVQGADESDVFKFKAKGGVPYEIKARPAGEKALLRFEKIWDSDGNSLIPTIGGQLQAPSEGAVLKVDKISVPKDGYIYVKIGGAFYEPEIIYSLAVGENSVESPPKPKAPAAK